MIKDLHYIYCPNCKAIKRLRRDYMVADGRNTHDAEDLVCADCHFVIATLHASDAPLVPQAETPLAP